jgi:acetyl-CoA C-acetyltransferase
VSTIKDNDSVVVSVARTAICKVGGSFSPLSATQLGSFVVKAAVERAKVSPSAVEEAFIGNVISAGLGQAPARQAVIKAGSHFQRSKYFFLKIANHKLNR